MKRSEGNLSGLIGFHQTLDFDDATHKLSQKPGPRGPP